MIYRCLLHIYITCILIVINSSTLAAVISVDADTTTPGIQSTYSVNPTTTFNVDIIVSDVVGLSGFEFDLVFSSTVISANSIIDGGFLADPTFELQNNISSSSAELALITLGLTTVSGSGVLGTIIFTADTVGTTYLDISDVLLSGLFGSFISADELIMASINVVEPIPEPSTLYLFAIGIIFFIVKYLSNNSTSYSKTFTNTYKI